MNYCTIKNEKCEYSNSYGWCMVTACKKYPNRVLKTSITGNNNTLVFPYIIGKITFYTKKELIDWVLRQQDEDYGMGNNA